MGVSLRTLFKSFLSCFSPGRQATNFDNESDSPACIITPLPETSISLQVPETNSVLKCAGCLPNDLSHKIIMNGVGPVAFGGFADIYQGVLRRDSVSIKVAVKVIKTCSNEDPDSVKKRKRLRREVGVWLNLRHPNVLQLLGTTTGFGRFPAMVSPWAENGTLTSYLGIRWHNLTEIEILGLLRNVASGLHYLHSNSVVHGDLSGSNVFIHENGEACIADFGLSIILTELERSTFSTSLLARGTLRWAAPELFDLTIPEDGIGEERVRPTPQSDAYSFGSIMLQILSGRIPYYYYPRDGQVVHALSKGIAPEAPGCELITEQRWMFMRRCWSTFSGAQSRPSSGEISYFIEVELVSCQSRDN